VKYNPQERLSQWKTGNMKYKSMGKGERETEKGRGNRGEKKERKRGKMNKEEEETKRRKKRKVRKKGKNPQKQ